METTRLVPVLNLSHALFFLLAIRVTCTCHKNEHFLNTNEKKFQPNSTPNAATKEQRLTSFPLPSQAAAISTEKQLLGIEQSDHYKFNSRRSLDSFFNKNKFLQNRNLREVIDKYLKVSQSVGRGAETLKTRRSLHEQVFCESGWLSCSGRCVKGRDFGQTHDRYLECYCDENCENLNDCCYDYGHHCKNISEYKYPAGNVDILSNISNTSINLWGCVSPPIKRIPTGMAGVWMITDCPHDWTDARVREKCNLDSPLSIDNYEANIPVIAQDGKTYKNRFCSICHGVPEDETTNFPLDVSCDILPPSRYPADKAMEFMFSYCSISWNPPIGQKRRYCYSNIVDSCPMSAPVTLQNNCKHGLTEIVCSGYGTTYYKYRNIYCAACHFVTSLVCGPQFNMGFIGPGDYTKPKSFSIIMALDFSSTRHLLVERRQTKVFCSFNEVYDPHLELCRTGIENIPNQTNFDKYRVSVWLRNTTELSNWSLATANDSYNKKQLNSHFFSGFKLLFLANKLLVSNVEVEDVGKMYRVVFDIETREHMYNKMEKPRRTINSQLTLDYLLDFTKPTNVIIHSINFTIIKVTTRRLSCVRLQRYFRHEFVILSEFGSALYVNRTSEIFRRQDYYLSTSNDNSVDEVTVCRKRLNMSCNKTYTNFALNEVTEFPNKSVLWKAGRKIYDERYYEKENGTIWICTNFSSSGTKVERLLEKTERSLYLLTVFGLSSSLTLLLALLLTYCLIGELRTLPGINLMNLSVSLMLGQLIWLIGSGMTVEKKVCSAIALAIHFAFLSSFIWMTIIAMDTCRSFAKKGQRINRMSNRSKRKRYLRSMAIGWLSPLVFCGICFTLDQTNTVVAVYGGTKGCWIQNTTSRLYFFAIPIGILLLINVVFFVLTVKAIRETVANAQMATTQNSRKKSFKVYMRIAALMGFTWVFGFLSSLHLYLSYVFVISCTLQGVYIAVAFLFTRRVGSLLTKLVTKDKSLSALVSNIPPIDSPCSTNTHLHKVRQDEVDIHPMVLINERDKENVDH